MTANAEAPARKRVAVMQPYFFPYAGYFRLLNAVDHFVIFDCVQFPRRGRVHRTQVEGPNGEVEWLTLPLQRQPRDVLIKDLAFAPDARATLDARLARFDWFSTSGGCACDRLRAYLLGPLGTVDDYLESGLRLAADLLGFHPQISRSSDLGLPSTLKAQQRVIAIVKAVGGADYVNAPGGRGIYVADDFVREELTLSFLSPYRGPYACFLQALMTQPLSAIRADIVQSSILEPATPDYAGGVRR